MKLNKEEMKKVLGGTSGNDDKCNGNSSCGGTCTNSEGKVGDCMTNIWAQCRCTTGVLKNHEDD